MLSKKIVIVSGGTGLIGKELVRAVLFQNGIAIIADIDDKGGLLFQEELKQNYPSQNIEFIKLDITSINSITSMINKINRLFGRIDAVVNCAYPKNSNFGRKFFDVKYDDFCDNINKHLGGYFLVSQQLAKYFIEQGYGNIINIASIYGMIAPRFEIYENTDMTMPVEYAAIKSAIIHLTKYMAKYLKGTKIRVNSISPGGIYNNQPEKFISGYKEYSLSKGLLDTKDLTGTLLYLLSDMSEYVSGQNLIIDDGFSL